MARPLFQDIVPPDKRSIQRIPVPDRKQPGRPRPGKDWPEVNHPKIIRDTTMRERGPEEREELRIADQGPLRRAPASPDRPRYKKPKSGFPWRSTTFLFIALCAIGGAIFYMSRSASTKITLTPRVEAASVNQQFTATQSAVGSTTGGTAAGLEFQTVTLTKDGSMQVKAAASHYVETKATGSIIIYNNYSKAPQKLIANTRFATPDGLIFRIGSAVTVPGKSGSTPGSVKADVTADEAGAQYNVGLVDLTIPGFKGEPQYSGFYARTIPDDPIQGGLVGTTTDIDPASLSAAQDTIDAELDASLLSQARGDIPEGYILPGNAYTITYKALPSGTATSSADTQVATVNQEATFHGLIFKTDELATLISAEVNGTALTDQTGLIGANNLQFALVSSGTSTDAWNASEITFSLTGTTTLVSTIDTNSLLNDLVSKPRKNLNAILTGYPSVAKAEVTMTPFWRTTFPDNPNAITVVVTNPL
jgi:hypothetical protein